MKIVSTHKSLYFINRNQIIDDVLNNLICEVFREILLLDLSIYNELFKYFDIEKLLIDTADEFFVLEQSLMNISQKKLIQVIKGMISLSRLVEIIRALQSKNKKSINSK